MSLTEAIRRTRHRIDRNPRMAVPDVLRNEKKVVGWISELTHEPPETVRRRLREEYEDFGTNVCRAMEQAGLAPFVWTDELVRFYEQTDSFLYELVTWNMSRLKAWMRQWVVRLIESELGCPSDVLCLGDGPGIDAAQLASLGHRVTYFELSGYTEAFARRVFADQGVSVTVIMDEAELPTEAFDAVVSLDVLEHVPDPPAMIRSIVSRLRPGGCLLVNAPYLWLHPSNPTHLKSNRKYSGSMALYEREGLQLANGVWTWSPLALRKPGGSHPRRLSAALNRCMIRAFTPYLLVGRLTIVPFLWGDFLRHIEGRWFPEPADRSDG